MRKPKKCPTLTKDGLVVKCQPLHNVPFITPSYEIEEDADPPSFAPSSEEEGEWTTVEKKKKKPRKKKKKASSTATPSKSAEELLHEHCEGRAAKPRSCP